MHSHDNDKCAPQGDLDGRRDTEQSADQNADRVAFPTFPDMANGTMRVTHVDGKVLNLSANVYGKGGLLA